MLHMKLFCEWYIFECAMLDDCLCQCYTHENKKYDAIQIEASISDNCLLECNTQDYFVNDTYLKVQC
jgi:hypothetical protein